MPSNYIKHHPLKFIKKAHNFKIIDLFSVHLFYHIFCLQSNFSTKPRKMLQLTSKITSWKVSIEEVIVLVCLIMPTCIEENYQTDSWRDIYPKLTPYTKSDWPAVFRKLSHVQIFIVLQLQSQCLSKDNVVHFGVGFWSAWHPCPVKDSAICTVGNFIHNSVTKKNHTRISFISSFPFY